VNPEIQGFVLEYLREIEAEVREAEGVYTVVFPAGRKRRFGGERRFTFDAQRVQNHVELLEPGSPLLKLFLEDAKAWGGIGVLSTPGYAPGTILFTFQLTTFSSLKKRTKFATAILSPDATSPQVTDGVAPVFRQQASDATSFRDLAKIQNALPMVLPRIEGVASDFAKAAVKESAEAFAKSLGRVNEYFAGLKQETASDETRIRKRLGEIQSKLYFAEDGLRQLKLERERDRLTQELYVLKQKRTQHEEKLSTNQVEHIERQRRRHEPKLSIRLVSATLVTNPSPVAPRPPPAPAAAERAPPVASQAPHMGTEGQPATTAEALEARGSNTV
jgi:hypothetical protein